MKFSIAAAVAATSSFVGVVSSSSSTSKSGKGSCSSSSPELETFCNEKPANFEGTYKLCYQNVVREAAEGVPGPSGAFHFCEFPPNAFERVFDPLDEYGAYESAIVHGVFDGQLDFQGIAQGNSIKMTSYGGGVRDDDSGNVTIPNDTHDTQECTLYKDGILKCFVYLQEHCGPETSFGIDCEVGDWLLAYTIESVSVLEGYECPEAPDDFCESNQVPGPPGRKLQEDETEKDDQVSPCPYLKGIMN